MLYLIAIKIYPTVFHGNLTVGQNSPSQLSRFLLEKPIAPQLVKNYPSCLELEDSSTHSQDVASRPYSNSDNFSSRLPILFPEDPF
jgi:hypothetical protein